MKSIPLKVVEVEIDGKKTKLSYKLQIFEAMKTPIDTRLASISEIRGSIRVMDALDATVGDTLELEDADFEFMKEKILKMSWPVIDKYVLGFIDDVTNPI